ncbi:MAG TPA: universal stress protein [Holophagaceae bacterium]|nr:universal stress protein [Holophagaceae bacterium]
MIKRILVAIDFSEGSRQALIQGAEWAGRLGLPLSVVHVIEVPRYPAGTPYVGLGDPSWFQEVSPKVEDRLKEWTSPYPGASTAVRSGSPAEVLMEEATPETLLVLGQVGHSKLEHLLFGSTAAKVVRHAPCDVLVVRAEKKG